MTINDIIKTCSNLDDELSIRSGGMRRKNEIFNDSIRRIPEEYKGATIRNWKVAPSSPGAGYDILCVEIDDRYVIGDVQERLSKAHTKRTIRESIQKYYKIYWHVKDNPDTYAHDDMMTVIATDEDDAYEQFQDRIVDEFDYGLGDIDSYDIVEAGIYDTDHYSIFKR